MIFIASPHLPIFWLDRPSNVCSQSGSAASTFGEAFSINLWIGWVSQGVGKEPWRVGEKEGGDRKCIGKNEEEISLLFDIFLVNNGNFALLVFWNWKSLMYFEFGMIESIQYYIVTSWILYNN